MNKQIKKKIQAVEMIVILIISGSVGYIFVARQGESSPIQNDNNNNSNQDIKTTTIEQSQSLKAHIKAGPIQGYSPLTVQFLGNPENNENIVSYNWEFGPRTSPIVPSSEYRDMHIPFVLLSLNFITMLFSKSFSTIAFVFLFTMASSLLSIVIHRCSARINSQYTSTDRDPTMVFLDTGSYSATLTVTDAQGNTSSDTIWITVLQYVYHYSNNNDIN
jgi:PKD repeat protein